MARNLLTATTIRNSLKPKLRDGDGLWLHASKTGTRAWVYIYVRGGRRREMGLGPFGSGTGQVSLAAARRKAEEIRSILGRGGDPFREMAERRAKEAVITMGRCIDEYIAAKAPQWRGAQTLPAWKRFAENYVKPIRGIPVGQVETDDVLRVLRPLWATKPETATKVRERLKLVLDAAKVRGLRTGDNPAQWKGHLDQLLAAQDVLARGHHEALPYNEVPALMARLRAVPSPSARVLEFMILTVARSGEARGAVWEEIDTTEKLWSIPASRMKSKRLHRVPLADRALKLVEDARALRIGALVFPGQRDGRPIADVTVAKVLRQVGGGKATAHGFRSAFRDWMAEETTFQREVGEAALAHAVGDSVERAYRRGDALAKRRELLAAWETFCNG